ncbi:polyphosphate polymerase domain-containing protein [Anaerosporobacter sp.]|uniref:polyphosphate polymerase domain-containing protein n=1 Tax=Anaerosporobacter sp. TaxID=1872529 RepID=UPI00286F3B83|nr:polyphosphate polymerase domain-containing protein [Anaerosporobacter sp.]
MAIEVFNRYENKYILNEELFAKVQQEITNYMEPDAYNKLHGSYTISNIYYDTEDNRLIRNSLSKPKYKEKLRLRAYGVPEKESQVYLEIKKKFRGLVNKRRSALQLNEAYRFIETGITPTAREGQNQQVLREISYILQTNELLPALYLAYDRCAYFGKSDGDLRISFDQNIRTRRYDLQLDKGDYGEALLPAGQWLMEVKSAESIPIWLCRLLSKHRIYPISFSKYGTEYKQLLQRERKEEQYV